MSLITGRILLAGMICLGAALAHAEPATAPATEPSPPQPQPQKDKEGEPLSVTEAQVQVQGQPLKYRATAGRLAVHDAGDEKAKGNYFFVAYEKLPLAADPSSRPITFLFNGGPGAASVWLHLGDVGPRRIALAPDGAPPSPPYHLEDNPDTWLSSSDLVFIDPIGTGYSRPVTGEKPDQFYGLQEDIKWNAEFIRLYTTRNQRWLSPKFLAGESYGTTRSAGLSSFLLDHDGIGLNGIVLISSVLNFQTLQADGHNDLPYVVYLPSFTAVAGYHHRLAPELQQNVAKAIDEAERWALGPYVSALAQGGSLPAAEREQIAKALSRYTSLPVDYILKSDLRIRADRFEAMLLQDQRQVIGRFDGRITGFNPDGGSSSAEYDPSLSPYLAAYAATFNDYVRRTLKYESDLSYDVLSDRVGPWNYGSGGGGYPDTSGSLQNAMLGNPALKVLFINGRQDLATPFTAADYTINHLHLSEELRSHITHNYYEGGHMLYHNRPTLTALNNDVKAFIEQASKPVKPTTNP